LRINRTTQVDIQDTIEWFGDFFFLSHEFKMKVDHTNSNYHCTLNQIKPHMYSKSISQWG